MKAGKWHRPIGGVAWERDGFKVFPVCKESGVAAYWVCETLADNYSFPTMAQAIDWANWVIEGF